MQGKIFRTLQPGEKIRVLLLIAAVVGGEEGAGDVPLLQKVKIAAGGGMLVLLLGV